MNLSKFIKEYLTQIESREFELVSNDLFDSCLDEGFPMEYEDGEEIKSWLVLKLNLLHNHSRKLVEFEKETVELFNSLDIEIKNRYNLNMIDLINYNTGEVFIFRYIKR